MVHFFRIAAAGLVIAVSFSVAHNQALSQIIKPPPGTTISYSYDALGRLIHVDNPIAGDRDYHYDPAGNRESVATNGDAHNVEPTAQNDSVMLTVDETKTIDLIANDSDPDGDALHIANYGQPGSASVTVTLMADNRSVQIHGTSGVSTSFTYTAADGYGGQSTATVSVVVFDGPGGSGDPDKGGS